MGEEKRITDLKLAHSFGEKSPTRAIVFIHGIMSSSKTFQDMRDVMEKTGLAKCGYGFFNVDYKWSADMDANAELFVKALEEKFGKKAYPNGSPHVTIIAHSMGGLVSRLALLTKELSFVKLLFLIGTPNSGAITMRQLTIYGQMLLTTTNVVSGFFPRLKGVPQLTQPAKVFAEKLKNSEHTTDIDYVSIAGTYFHDARGLHEGLFSGAHKTAFKLKHSFLAIWGAVNSKFEIKFDLPHDGIVEKRSNNMIEASQAHEKMGQTGAPTYAHLDMHVCDDLVHTEIHRDSTVIDKIVEIILDLAQLRSKPEYIEQSRTEAPTINDGRLKYIQAKRSEAGAVSFKFQS